MQTITITKDSFFLIRWFIKCYIWVWNPNLTSLTNCRLYWGVIFFPLAFMSYKKELRFIPRISILTLVISITLLSLGWWQQFAISAFFFSIIVIPVVFLSDYIEAKNNKKIVPKTQDNEDELLVDKYPRLDKALDKIMYSRVGDIIKKFVWWIMDIKEQKCSFVRVEL